MAERMLKISPYALQTLTNADGSPFSGTVHFTGQSLGGALAQYAAYAYALALGTVL